MAGVNESNVGLTFADQLVNDIVETLNNESSMRQYVKADTNWNGDYREGRVHVRRSGAVWYTEDGGAFPTPNKQTYVPYRTYRKFVAASIQLTDGAMAAAKKGKNVAKDVIQSETEGIMQEILKIENGMFFRDGTGSVGTVKATATTSPGDTYLTVDDARMLWEGCEYDLYNGSTFLSTFTVTSVAEAPTASNYASVDISPATSVTSGNKVYWRNSYGRAINGLDKLINDASETFQYVSTSTYPHYTSLVLDNSGTLRALTPGMFRSLLAGVRQRTGNKKPAQGLKCLSSSFQVINVEELYEAELRLQPSDKVAGQAIAAFQSALGRVDIIWNSDALYDKIFCCDFSQIGRAVQQPLSWRRDGGDVLKRSDVAGYYTGTALEISDLFIKERHTSAKLADLSYSLSSTY